MDLKSKQLQLQYQGCVNTPLLWIEQPVFGMSQLKIPKKSTAVINEVIPTQMRLGKRVERFVYSELVQHENIEIVVENAQIQDKKITVGEIDCILRYNGTPIHLEIVYKFYLYDESSGTSEIERWIGPNRNDTFLKKLHKLKDKQLPLLYNKHTNSLLEELQLNLNTIAQRVLFKAQLFIPYKFVNNIEFNLVNRECLVGFYVPFSELQELSLSKFYIPSKIDWLIEVHRDVNWSTYIDFHIKVSIQIREKRAPLCWIKFPNGVIQKFFVVWWI